MAPLSGYGVTLLYCIAVHQKSIQQSSGVYQCNDGQAVNWFLCIRKMFIRHTLYSSQPCERSTRDPEKVNGMGTHGIFVVCDHRGAHYKTDNSINIMHRVCKNRDSKRPIECPFVLAVTLFNTLLSCCVCHHVLCLHFIMCTVLVDTLNVHANRSTPHVQ